VQDELFVIRDLNQVDAEIDQANKAIRDGVSAVKETTARVAANKARLQAADAALAELQTRERELNRRVAELTGQRDRTRQLIDTGRAPDYARATLQLTQQETLLDDTETDLLETMEAREAAEKEQAVSTDAVARARKDDAAARQRYRDTSPGLKAEIAAKTAQRPPLLDKIEPDRRRQYEDLRKQGLDALSHVVRGACNRCYQNAPPQIANEVLSGRRIHTCRGCGRFFFAVREESD